jgi:hypothetical protein
MATTSKGATATPIPWYSWLALAGVIAVGAIIVIATARTPAVFPDWLKWGVTIVWIVLTIGLGIYDFILGGGTRAAGTFRAAAIDVKPFDRWTLSHTGAGLVFGVWFVPLVWVLVLVVAWEAFEMFVPGFGESEILANRAVDIGVALAGWLLLVVIGIIANPGTSFPLI